MMMMCVKMQLFTIDNNRMVVTEGKREFNERPRKKFVRSKRELTII